MLSDEQKKMQTNIVSSLESSNRSAIIAAGCTIDVCHQRLETDLVVGVSYSAPELSEEALFRRRDDLTASSRLIGNQNKVFLDQESKQLECANFVFLLPDTVPNELKLTLAGFRKLALLIYLSNALQMPLSNVYLVYQGLLLPITEYFNSGGSLQGLVAQSQTMVRHSSSLAHQDLSRKGHVTLQLDLDLGDRFIKENLTFPAYRHKGELRIILGHYHNKSLAFQALQAGAFLLLASQQVFYNGGHIFSQTVGLQAGKYLINPSELSMKAYLLSKES